MIALTLLFICTVNVMLNFDCFVFQVLKTNMKSCKEQESMISAIQHG